MADRKKVAGSDESHPPDPRSVSGGDDGNGGGADACTVNTYYGHDGRFKYIVSAKKWVFVMESGPNKNEADICKEGTIQTYDLAKLVGEPTLHEGRCDKHPELERDLKWKVKVQE